MGLKLIAMRMVMLIVKQNAMPNIVPNLTPKAFPTNNGLKYELTAVIKANTRKNGNTI